MNHLDKTSGLQHRRNPQAVLTPSSLGILPLRDKATEAQAQNKKLLKIFMVIFFRLSFLSHFWLARKQPAGACICAAYVWMPSTEIEFPALLQGPHTSFASSISHT